ncbi:MAG: 3'-5' exonuclease [Lachnospiraceae bacterium]|nr:3'-5' exonuclease [Lachnospiraceae bacterium]
MQSIKENEIQILSSQVPGTVSFNNYAELKEYLNTGLAAYQNIEYAAVSEAREDKAVLSAVKKKLTDKKKEIEKAYSAPFEEVSRQLDELIAVKAPLDVADKYIKTNEKKEKEQSIYSYAKERASVLGECADKIVDSAAFFNPKWLNATGEGTEKKWKASVDAIIEKAQKELAVIKSYEPEVSRMMAARYYETLSMDGMKDFIAVASEKSSEDEAPVDEGETGYRIIKITASELQMMKLMSQLEMADIEYEIIEDGMPKPMQEISDPNFDSFVAFDVEHTGTYGAANGDAPAELTEIGAVKVENGVIVDRFSQLINPKREIVGFVARKTNITNDMVKDAPDAEEVITQFRDFAGNSILLGHNIKGCDIPHITRAAKKAGITFGNSFFDTKDYAKKYKDILGFDNIKLEYLAEEFGIEQQNAHRAWCDAEVNAQVYLALKKKVEEIEHGY